LRVTVAGSWVLAILTLANFASPEAIVEGQARFAATGQDPNDVARFLDLGFPIAALLYDGERRWWGKAMAGGYLPVGLVAVLLTASRGGFLAAMVALAGCGVLLARGHAGRVLAGAYTLPLLAAGLWFAVPRETFERLATITEQRRGGDLNQRWNIWSAGWHAFCQAPIFGRGAGSFIVAAGTSPIDTAHNSALAILVEGGLSAFFVAVAIVAVAAWSAMKTRGNLRIALAATLLVWVVTSLVATVHESRWTWLLMGLIALADRMREESPDGLESQFPETRAQLPVAASAEPAL